MNRRLPKLLLALFSLALMGFIFMNTYEVVFNKDIVVANSVKKFAAQDQIQAIISQFNIKPDADEKHNAAYNKLSYIQIPAISSNLYLEEQRLIKGSWYYRPNLGHYISLNKDADNVTIDYLIYAEKSWQTLPDPNQIEQGMDVKLFHDGHNMSLFKVDEKQVLPLDTTFVASKSENRQIILLVEDADRHVYYAFSLVLKD